MVCLNPSEKWMHPAVGAGNQHHGFYGEIMYGIGVHLPYQALLTKTGSGDHLCGAVIINTYVLLTAAHCLYLRNQKCQRIPDKDLRITVGHRAHHEVVPHFMMVRKSKTVPTHNCKFPFRNDLAILVLETELVLEKGFIETIPLPNSKSDVFTGHARISGWGNLENNSDFVRYTTVKINNDQKCVEVFKKLYKPETMMCTGGEGKGGQCPGDSGGPITCPQNGKQVLCGIASFGRLDDTKGNFPSRNVKVTAFLDVISDTIREFSSIKPSKKSKSWQELGLCIINSIRKVHSVPHVLVDPQLDAEAEKEAQKLINSSSVYGIDNGNVYILSGNIPYSKSEAIRKAIFVWYKKRESYDWKNHSTYSNFSQLVWKANRKVGLGIAQSGNKTVVIAKFSPGGNFVGHFKDNVFNATGKPSSC